MFIFFPELKKCPFVKDESGGMQALNLAVAASMSLTGESKNRNTSLFSISPHLKNVGPRSPVIVCCKRLFTSCLSDLHLGSICSMNLQLTGAGRVHHSAS